MRIFGGLLVQNAWRLVRSKCSNTLKSHYEAIIDRGNAASIAVVATARKLLAMVYILLTRRECYRYTDEVTFALHWQGVVSPLRCKYMQLVAVWFPKSREKAFTSSLSTSHILFRI